MLLDKTSDEFGTPIELFTKLHKEFQFTLDAAASKKNFLLPRYYTKKDSALKHSWAQEKVFCNPPYSRGNMLPFVKKAYQETALGNCLLVVMLLPVRTEQPWFHRYIWRKSEVRFIPGRLKYQGGQSSARFASMIVIFRNPYSLLW